MIKLGLPGRVVGVDIDTSYFNGNHPHAIKLEGVNLPTSPVCISEHCVSFLTMLSTLSRNDTNTNTLGRERGQDCRKIVKTS